MQPVQLIMLMIILILILEEENAEQIRTLSWHTNWPFGVGAFDFLLHNLRSAGNIFLSNGNYTDQAGIGLCSGGACFESRSGNQPS
jgi:hypothetical protein